MTYVSHDELDKILRAYEKAGNLENISKTIDTNLRKHLQDVSENHAISLKKEIETKITNQTSKFESQIRQTTENMKSSIVKEINDVIKYQIDVLNKSVLSENLKVIDKKFQEVRSYLDGSITQKLTLHEKEYANNLSIAKREIYSQFVNFQTFVENLCVTSIQKAIESQKSTIENLVQSTLKEEYQKIKEDVSQLRSDIMNELENKIVDKKMIDERIAQIENELVAKTHSLIEFQLEQSRVMMEQSARAEIAESLKVTSKNILNALV